jgi:predicted phosphate transport protein (TIGR00153 family)
MAFSLIPREQSFFDLFEQSADILLKAADLLVEATEHIETLPENAKRLERLEHDGDQVTHEVMARLNRTFITPFDREDIHQLVSALDDVLDLVEATTERFILYKITVIAPSAKQLSQVIKRQIAEIHLVMPKLRHMRHEHVMEHCIEINRLENAGDRLFRDSISTLFDGSTETLLVIKWHDLYTLLESATDRCEDVANIIEGVVLKNA